MKCAEDLDLKCILDMVLRLRAGKRGRSELTIAFCITISPDDTYGF